MVRKIIAIFSVCLALSCMTCQAAENSVSSGDSIAMYENAVEVYSNAIETYATALEVYQGTISTTYLQFFRDIVNGLGVTDDYLVYRSSDNEYSMIVGDITNSGNEFYMNSGQIYNIENISGSGYGYNSYYKYTVSDITDVTVNTGDYLVYSNIGNYPDLVERSNYYAFGTLFIIMVIGICIILRSFFNFTYRSRRR